MSAVMTERDERRFFAKVGLPDENGCMPWLAAVDRKGYGQFSFHGTAKAHRLMHELTVGPIPAGFDVDHRCGNGRCVAPLHLRAATRKQNAENRGGANRNSESGARGVTRCRGKWRARVRHNGQLLNLGTFDRLEDADAAARAARAELFTHADRDRVAS